MRIQNCKALYYRPATARGGFKIFELVGGKWSSSVRIWLLPIPMCGMRQGAPKRSR